MSTEKQTPFVGVTQEQHRQVLDSIDKLIVAVDRIDMRVTSHMVAEHKDFDELIQVVKGGKMAAKIIGICIALIAGAGAFWEWVRHNLYVSMK